MNGSASVLVVDDDLSSLAMLGLTLRQAGYDVKTVPGAEEALRLLREEDFDWMITDARMLPMDGFELSRQAREIDPGLRIVMVSAENGAGGAAGYPIEAVFSKPVSADKLLSWMSNGRA